MIWLRADLEISKNKLLQNKAVYCMGQQLLLGFSQSSCLECSKCHPSYWVWSLGPKDLGQGYQRGCFLLLGAAWTAASTDMGTGGAVKKHWQPNGLCGDLPDLGDISPLSWSARLVSMQDMLPKAQVVCSGTSLTNLWDLLAGHC